MPRFLLTVLLCLGAPQALHANDGYGGLSATGLQLQATSHIRMVSEDVFLSSERIKGKEDFQNEHPEKVRGQIIFPVPPISLTEMVETSFVIDPDRLAKDDAVGFTALVNGKPVKVQTDQIAVRSRSIEKQRSSAPQFEGPGGIFVWPKPGEPLDSCHQDLINICCIDPSTQKALGKLIQPSADKQSAPGAGSAVLLDYVLTTANTWQCPIATFRLTIDKGKSANILSLWHRRHSQNRPDHLCGRGKEFQAHPGFTPAHGLLIVTLDTLFASVRAAGLS